MLSMKKVKPILATVLAQGAAFAAPCSTVPFPELSAPCAVTSGPHEHFLANYFGINAWNPGNRLLAFNSVHEGSRQIYVMDAESGPEKESAHD